MAAIKNFTDIRYFVKNSITTDAFARTFVGSSTGTGTAYPYSVLNDTPGFTSISDNYEIKFPTLLPTNCTLTNGNATVTAVSGNPFLNALVGDYLLYDNAGVDNLKVLGVIATKTSNAEVVLAKNAVVTTGTYPVYLLKKGGASVGFKSNSSFYMLVKSSTFAVGGRDGVLWLDVPNTHSTPAAATAAISLGWGGGPNVPANINPEYFNFFAISKINIADEGASPIVETDIPCTIRRISSYYTSNFVIPTTDDIPYWVAYEVNPFGDSSINLDKKTTFKIQFSEDLPAGQLGVNNSTTYTQIQQGAL